MEKIKLRGRLEKSQVPNIWKRPYQVKEPPPLVFSFSSVSLVRGVCLHTLHPSTKVPVLLDSTLMLEDPPLPESPLLNRRRRGLSRRLVRSPRPGVRNREHANVPWSMSAHRTPIVSIRDPRRQRSGWRSVALYATCRSVP